MSNQGILAAATGRSWFLGKDFTGISACIAGVWNMSRSGCHLSNCAMFVYQWIT